MKSHGPDSRNSWVIAVACGVISLLALLPIRLGAQMFVAFLDRYNIDQKAASFPLGLAYMMKSLSGPFAGYFGSKFGLQKVTLFGCLLYALGNGLCYFAEDIVAINICLGLIFGIGSGWSTALTPEILNQHFEKYRAVAVGINFGFSGLGAFMFPPVFEMLLKEYGLSSSFLILGAILLNGVPAAMLIHKLRFTTKVDTVNDGEKSVTNNVGEDIKTPSECNEQENLFILSNKQLLKGILSTSLMENHSLNHNKQHISYDESNHSNKDNINHTPNDFININIESKTSTFLKSPISTEKLEINLGQYEDLRDKWSPIILDSHELNKENKLRGTSSQKMSHFIQINPLKTSPSKAKSMCDSLKVLWSPIFLAVTLILSLYYYVVYIWWTVIVDVVREKHMSGDTEVYFVIFMALFDTLGRFVLGIITDKGYMTTPNFCVLCFSFMGLTCLMMPWVSGFYTTMFVICFFGMMSGGNATGTLGLVTKFFDKNNRTMAMASREILYVPMSFTMSPLIGYFKGNLGSYDGVFYVSTVLCIFCSLLLITLSRIFRNKKKEETG